MIPGTTQKTNVNGSVTYKLKTPRASFSLKPVKGQHETYTVQVTPRDLGGAFKNSGALYEGAAENSTNSIFGPFLVQRYPGRNAVSRPLSCGPIAGNAVLMWLKLDQIEKIRLFDQIEKLIRSEIPRIESAAAPKPGLKRAA
jgi:hypothetical protein